MCVCVCLWSCRQYTARTVSWLTSWVIADNTTTATALAAVHTAPPVQTVFVRVRRLLAWKPGTINTTGNRCPQRQQQLRLKMTSLWCRKTSLLVLLLTFQCLSTATGSVVTVYSIFMSPSAIVGAARWRAQCFPVVSPSVVLLTYVHECYFYGCCNLNIN